MNRDMNAENTNKYTAMNKHGMYGGKFIPFHKGHQYCIKYAASQCERLTVILFINGDDEVAIQNQETIIPKDELTIDSRISKVSNFCKSLKNVDFVVMDCKKIYATLPDIQTWDAETPFVQAICHDMDAVYSSEPRYDDYFKRAYPYAKHILVDPPREIVPISATMIRNMNLDDGNKWR